MASNQSSALHERQGVVSEDVISEKVRSKLHSVLRAEYEILDKLKSKIRVGRIGRNKNGRPGRMAGPFW